MHSSIFFFLTRTHFKLAKYFFTNILRRWLLLVVCDKLSCVILVVIIVVAVGFFFPFLVYHFFPRIFFCAWFLQVQFTFFYSSWFIIRMTFVTVILFKWLALSYFGVFIGNFVSYHCVNQFSYMKKKIFWRFFKISHFSL